MSVSALLQKYLIPDELLNDSLSFIYSPFLMHGKITTLFAVAGGGKSTFSYKLVYGLLENQVINKCLCVFSDADTTNEEFKALVDRFYDKNDIENSRFLPMFPVEKGFWKDFNKLIEDGMLKESGFDLVIIDSLEYLIELLGMDFHRVVGKFYALMRKLAIQGISVLILHHTNKENKTFSGRSVIANQSDALYGMKRAGKDKWFFTALKHRGGRLLNGKVDFLAYLNEDGELVVDTDVVDERYSYAVNLIKQVLGAKRELNQHQIIREVQQLSKEQSPDGSPIGINKIREALRKYDGIFWKSQKGEGHSFLYKLIVDVKVADSEDQVEEVKECDFSPEPENREPNEKEWEILTKLREYVESRKEKGRRGSGVKEAIEEVARDLADSHLTEEEREKLEVLAGRKRLKKEERKELESIKQKREDFLKFYLEEVSRVLRSFGSYAGLVKEGEWLLISDGKDDQPEEDDLPIDF